MTTVIAARMAVEIDGEGEPLLMLHGLGGTSNSFTPQIEALAARFRVLRPDLPGSGRSAIPDRLSVATLVGSLVSLCDALGLASIHVVGHSLGTILAQHLATERPGLVRSMALLGALAEPPDPARRGLRERAAAVRLDGMDQVATAVAAAGTSADTKANLPAALAFIRESLMRQPPEGYALTCEALAEARAAELRALRRPLLVITGDEDATAPPSVGRRIAEQVEGGRFVQLARTGHWPSIERGKDVNRELLGFYTSRLR